MATRRAHGNADAGYPGSSAQPEPSSGAAEHTGGPRGSLGMAAAGVDPVKLEEPVEQCFSHVDGLRPQRCAEDHEGEPERLRVVVQGAYNVLRAAKEAANVRVAFASAADGSEMRLSCQHEPKLRRRSTVAERTTP